MLVQALLLAAALVGTVAPAVRDVNSLETALGALSSDRASDRVEGERWLGAHLEREDYALLAEAVLRSGREARTRIVRALGGDDRHLGLCVLLASDKAPELVALGEEAMRELAGRWHTGLGLPMALDGPNQAVLREALIALREEWPAERYRLRADGTLSEVAGRLARLAELPLAICIDPYTKETRVPGTGSGRTLEGTWDELLLELAVEYGVDLAGALTTDEKRDVLPLFVCFRPRGSHIGTPAVSELIDWCRQSLGDGPRAVRAARALAGTGWPAALQWMDRRYRATSEPAAEAGLLLAAARGRVSLALSREEVVARLLERAESAPEARTAEPIMHALSKLLPATLSGARLDELVGRELGASKGRSLALRLVVLEGMTSSSKTVQSALREVLARPPAELAAAGRLQALRAWASVSDGRAVELNGIGRLLGNVSDSEAGEELVRLLAAAGVAPSEYWGRPGTTSNYSIAARAAALEWQLAFGRNEAAADYLEVLTRWKTGWPSEPETFRATAEVARVLRRRVRAGDGARIGHWLEELSAVEASGPTPRPAARRALHRIVVLSGAPSPESLERDLSCLTRALPDAATATEFSPGDEVLLGILSSRATAAISRPARNYLFQLLARSLTLATDIPANVESARRALSGIEHCAVELLSRGDDLQAELLARDIRGLFLRFNTHPLSERVRASSWPPGPSAEPRELERLDRVLAVQ